MTGFTEMALDWEQENHLTYIEKLNPKFRIGICGHLVVRINTRIILIIFYIQKLEDYKG